MATVGRINVFLGADTAAFTSKLDRARRDLSKSSTRMNRSLAKIGRGFKNAGKSAALFAKSMVGLRGAAVLAAGVAGLGLLTKRALDTADSIAKTADAIGITTDALQEYRFALDISGVAMEKTDKGLKKFVRNMGELARSSSETQTALKDLDPALLANLRSLNSVEDQLALGFRALAGYSDQSKRAAVAAALFGRAGVEMTVAVKEGIVAFEGLQQKARSLGLVIREDLLRNAEDAKDELNILARVIGVNVTAAILEAAPEIERLSKVLSDGIPAILSYGRAISIVFGIGTAESVDLASQIIDLNVRIARADKALESLFGRLTVGAEFDRFTALVAERDRLRARLRGALQREKPPPTPRAPGIEAIVGGLTPRAKPFDVAAKAASEAARKRLQLQDDLTAAIRKQEAAARQNLDTVLATVQTNQERYQAELDFLAKTKLELLETGQLTTANEAILERGAEAAKKRFQEMTAMAGQARAAMDPMIQAAERMAWTFDNALENALRGNIRTFEDLRRVAIDTLQDIINQTIRLLAIQGGATGKESVGGLISKLVVSGIGLLFPPAGIIAGTVLGNTNVSGFGGPLPKMAHGGDLAAGQMAIVGERGRELFIPDVSGSIIPNNQLGAAGGGQGSTVIVNQNITTPDANSFRANSRQISRLAKQQFSFA